MQSIYQAIKTKTIDCKPFTIEIDRESLRGVRSSDIQTFIKENAANYACDHLTVTLKESKVTVKMAPFSTIKKNGEPINIILLSELDDARRQVYQEICAQLDTNFRSLASYFRTKCNLTSKEHHTLLGQYECYLRTSGLDYLFTTKRSAKQVDYSTPAGPKVF